MVHEIQNFLFDFTTHQHFTFKQNINISDKKVHISIQFYFAVSTFIISFWCESPTGPSRANRNPTSNNLNYGSLGQGPNHKIFIGARFLCFFARPSIGEVFTSVKAS